MRSIANALWVLLCAAIGFCFGHAFGSYRAPAPTTYRVGLVGFDGRAGHFRTDTMELPRASFEDGAWRWTMTDLDGGTNVKHGPTVQIEARRAK